MKSWPGRQALFEFLPSARKSGTRSALAARRSGYEEGDASESFALAEYATELADDIVVVTDGNRPLAALVPLKNVHRESLALSTHPEFMKLVKRSRKEFDLGKTVSLDEMRSRVRRMRSPNTASQPPEDTRRRKSAEPRSRARRG